MKTKRYAVALLALATFLPCPITNFAGKAHAADYAFVGKWDCESLEFKFTNRTYNNGSETYPILKVKRRKNDYQLSFKMGYAIPLLNVRERTMIWHSLATADTFNCKRSIKDSKE